ncbi:hypothetical protein N7462_005540 [Penicillium macrosclerotiorum]|uniref:uncharacterized protein n=1 Tax=Penicillium macrosclerotiorum TaxID=303699 RepID=UPI002549125E|nr:uncharacterized protein N7462_005540 [Penicillium macrosclerotiorum]KAJ5682375.1 hypothetical protein N7462_005540 [Penicillium macrosclerotiorum]
MPPPPLERLLSGSLPDHCEPTSRFLTAISSHLHICLPTPLALISSVLGTLSIVSWLFAQLPQIYKNYQLQSTSGLSIFFLVIWCAGDASNLLGALFTRQAGWQVVVASYYVFVDVTLVIQFFWYTHYKSRRYDGYGELPHSHDHHTSRGPVLQGVALPDNDVIQQAPGAVDMAHKKTEVQDMGVQTGSTLNSTLGRTPPYTTEKFGSSPRPVRTTSISSSPPFALPRTMLVASLVCAVLANASPTESTPSPHPPISHAPRETILEIVGRIFSWMSTILYLGSRPPQLYKNYCRKSTEGLSPLLFMAAFSGNLFYSSSLLTNPNAWSDFPPYGGGGWADVHGNDRWEWIGRAIPFFLGAFGVLGLDGYMGVQFLMYGPRDTDDEIYVGMDDDDEDSKRGRGRWRRVRGWMRGWIPSASPSRSECERTSVPQEAQALLGSDRGRYGTV